MPSPSLRRARIRYTDRARGRLKCLECGAEWADKAGKQHIQQQRRRTGWWKCPGGCNTVAEGYYFPPPGEMEGGS